MRTFAAPAALLAVLFAAAVWSVETAARAPAQEAASPPAASVPDHAELTGVVQRYCRTCHNDRMLTGNLSLEDFAVGTAAGNPEEAARTEKMIRKLRANMMPPPGVRRPDAGTLGRARRDAGIGGGPGRRGQSEPGLPDLPAAEPVRVRAGRPRSARPADRRGRLPAARHDERQLRQHRRRSTAVGDAARRLPAGRDRGRPARRRQSQRGPEADDVLEVAGLLAVGPGGRRTVRHARRVLGGAQLPRRRGLPLHDGVPAHDHRRSVGIDHPQRADRDLDRRRAGGAAGDGPVAAHLRPQRRVPGGRGADLRPRRAAAGLRGVRPPVRRAGGGRAGPARVVDRRHRDRRPGLRRHRPAAHARLHHRRSLRRDRGVRDAEPAAGLHLPPDVARHRASLRRGDRHPHRHPGLPPAR